MRHSKNCRQPRTNGEGFRLTGCRDGADPAPLSSASDRVRSHSPNRSFAGRTGARRRPDRCPASKTDRVSRGEHSTQRGALRDAGGVMHQLRNANQNGTTGSRCRFLPAICMSASASLRACRAIAAGNARRPSVSIYRNDFSVLSRLGWRGGGAVAADTRPCGVAQLQHLSTIAAATAIQPTE
jgi:hypothetical protein